MKMKVEGDKDDRFRTRIKEPRWQQIVSVAIVLASVAGWLIFLLR